MADTPFVERVWYGDDAGARAARLALAPLELLYRGVVAARGALYAAGALRVHDTALPSVSVGNVSVGGTGKTPTAAWLAARLAELGAKPAIVLRGYGDDEPLVHRRLNPSVPVIVSADRVAGVLRAKAAGADVAVLDDAFQHRRARRTADIVLVSADGWSDHAHLLPAGPLREPLGALRRASLVIVTRKAASERDAEAVSAAVRAVAPAVPQAVVHLAPAELVSLDGEDRQPLSELLGRRVRALAAIGDPRAFVRQLEGAGAQVRAEFRPDHHHFGDEEIAAFARSVAPEEIAVCTLKDAVKLADRWPAAGVRLWYVSQHVVVERGSDAVDVLIHALLRARTQPSPNAG